MEIYCGLTIVGFNILGRITTSNKARKTHRYIYPVCGQAFSMTILRKVVSQRASVLFSGCGELNYARDPGDVTLEATVSLFRFKILLF